MGLYISLQSKNMEYIYRENFINLFLEMVAVNDFVWYLEEGNTGNYKQRTDVGYKYVAPFPILLDTIKFFNSLFKTV